MITSSKKSKGNILRSVHESLEYKSPKLSGRKNKNIENSLDTSRGR
jgi:hypothetical protein